MDTGLQKVDAFIAAIEDAKSLDEIFQILRPHVEELGFQKFAYWLVWPPEGPRRSIYINSYPIDWMEYYMANNLGAEDMVMRYAATQVRPYTWQDIHKTYELTKPQRIVFSEGADAGLRSGATVPIFGPGNAKAVFSVSNEQPQDEFDKVFLEARHPLHLLATYAHEKIMALGLHKRDLDNIQLTAREIDILNWVSRGKTNWEISKIINISEATVKRHIDNICAKLNVQNKTHAAASALTHGLILP